MDIYQRLIEDHGKQRGLAGGLARTEGDSDERRRLFDAYATELEAHADAEEQTLYAELLSEPDIQEQARHSIAEHQTADNLLNKLRQTDMSSSAWLQTFKELRHAVEHHLEEEEEKVFPQARELISETRAQALGRDFAERKKREARAA